MPSDRASDRAHDRASDEIDAEVPAPPAGMRGSLGPLFRLVRDQRVAFLLVGGTNTVIGAVWFILFQHLVQQRFGYMAVLGCAHVASVLCAFVLYRTFVFRVRGHLWRDLGRFEVINLGALAFNVAMLPLLVEVAHFPVLASQLLIAAVTVVFSWFGHRNFSFRRSADSIVPDSIVPNGTLPDSTVPASTVPDGTLPDGTVPGSTVPDSTLPDSTEGSP